MFSFIISRNSVLSNILQKIKRKIPDKQTGMTQSLMIQSCFFPDSPERIENAQVMSSFFSTNFPDQTILMDEYIPAYENPSNFSHKNIQHRVFGNKSSFVLSEQRNAQIDYALEKNMDFLVLMDVDCIVNPKDILDAVSFLANNNPYRWGWVYSGKLRQIPRNKNILDMFRQGKWISARAAGQRPKWSQFKYKSAQYIFNIKKGSIRYFSEEYKKWGCEDLDFYLDNIKHENIPIRTHSDIYHIEHPKPRSLDSFYGKSDSADIFKRKHGVDYRAVFANPEKSHVIP